MIFKPVKSCAAALLAAAALGGAGCASIGNVQMADTLGKGNIQVGIEPGVQALGAGTFVAYPHIDGSIRYGITDSVDIGARLGQSLAELQAKFLFTRPGDPNLAVSLAPTFGGIVVGGGTGGASASVGVLNIGVPVLIGIKTRGGSELVIGPRIQNWVVFAGAGTGSGSGSAAAYVMGLGGSVGFAFRASDSFALLPEVSLVYPVFGSAGVTGSTAATAGIGGGLMLQFKLGLLLGRMRSLAPEPSNFPPPPGPNFGPPPPPPPAMPMGDPPPPPPPPP